MFGTLHVQNKTKNTSCIPRLYLVGMYSVLISMISLKAQDFSVLCCVIFGMLVLALRRHDHKMI